MLLKVSRELILVEKRGSSYRFLANEPLEYQKRAPSSTRNSRTAGRPGSAPGGATGASASSGKDGPAASAAYTGAAGSKPLDPRRTASSRSCADAAPASDINTDRDANRRMVRALLEARSAGPAS